MVCYPDKPGLAYCVGVFLPYYFQMKCFHFVNPIQACLQVLRSLSLYVARDYLRVLTDLGFEIRYLSCSA